MRRLILPCLLLWSIGGYVAFGRAAEPEAKATHVLRPLMVDVAATRPNGDAWDTGIGAFSRPDLQVTLLRQDAKAIEEATMHLVRAQERQLKDLGQPVRPEIKALFGRNAMQILRCGAAVAALKDEPLSLARAKFAGDSGIVNDTALAKLSGGELAVAAGDKLLVFVNDIDLTAHDLMGQYELEITKQTLAKNELELKFDSVTSLRLSVARLGK
jgi:thioesterase domain-containing protein